MTAKSMRLLAGTAVAALLAYSPAASAADIVAPEPEPNVWYASIFGGVVFPEDIDADFTELGVQTYDEHQEMKTGFLVGAALGTTLWENLRVEAEVSYMEIDAGDALYDNPGNYPYNNVDGDISAIYLLGNLWYDIPLSDYVRPYLGGGAGIAFVDVDIEQEPDFGPDDSDEGFAFQLGAGFNIPLADGISLDVGYRFRGILDIDADERGNETDAHENMDIYTHNVIGGLKVDF